MGERNAGLCYTPKVVYFLRYLKNILTFFSENRTIFLVSGRFVTKVLYKMLNTKKIITFLLILPRKVMILLKNGDFYITLHSFLVKFMQNIRYLAILVMIFLDFRHLSLLYRRSVRNSTKSSNFCIQFCISLPAQY